MKEPDALGAEDLGHDFRGVGIEDEGARYSSMRSQFAGVVPVPAWGTLERVRRAPVAAIGEVLVDADGETIDPIRKSTRDVDDPVPPKRLSSRL